MLRGLELEVTVHVCIGLAKLIDEVGAPTQQDHKRAEAVARRLDRRAPLKAG